MASPGRFKSPISNSESETPNLRSIAFVTGTRAEFGLMRPALEAIRAHPRLQLQLIVTGMHLDRSRGYSLEAIRRAGWGVDRVVAWDSERSTTPSGTARATGEAIAGLVRAFDELGSEIVLVVGDRVEAFAAAAAGHIAGRVVAHVHGGDRAAGQVDDSLRHAITKLAHVHFPATAASAARLIRLGEDRRRVHRVGAPGIDGIRQEAADARQIREAVGWLTRRRFALLVLHPAEADDAAEYQRARLVAGAVADVPFSQIVIVHPNNDPGAAGIVRAWDELSADPRFIIRRDLPRPVFLGLMRDAAVLAGDSSSGIIEAASFGTPVLDIGARQRGRERGANVVNVPYRKDVIRRALAKIWNDGRPRRFTGANLYGGAGAGRRIANVLASVKIDERLLRKLIAY
jgi:UDP-hydrolysing UDP-N-acetyl-D-glucosamine 2-epimerase